MTQTTSSFVSRPARATLTSLVVFACVAGCASGTDATEQVLLDELESPVEIAALSGGGGLWLARFNWHFTTRECVAAGGTVISGGNYAKTCKQLGASGGICKLTGAEACAAGLVPAACAGATMAPYATCPLAGTGTTVNCSADVVRACLR